MASYETEGKSDEWYTPQYVFDALDCEFDMDVASPGCHNVPWIPAKSHLIRDSLSQKWHGFVWMNPPYGKRNGVIPWRDKFIEHGNGIALVPSRTGTEWWQVFADKSHDVFFPKPKIKFVKPDGTIGRSPGTGSTMFGIGWLAGAAFDRAQMNGLGIKLQRYDYQD